jgi:hypothetical protein
MSGKNKASPRTALHASKQISIIVMAAVVFAATLAVSCHYHDDMRTRSTCAVCKSAQQLAAGDTEDLFVPAPPDPNIFTYITVATESFIDPIISSQNTRAPPHSLSAFDR